jgi:hypothetical protein
MNGWKTAKRHPRALASKHQAMAVFIFDFGKRAAAGIKAEIPAVYRDFQNQMR